MLALLCIQAASCYVQICEFQTADFELWDRIESYYSCELENIRLTDEYERVKTLTGNNPRSDSDVEAVVYGPGNELAFISSYLFVEFPNMKFLRVQGANLQTLETHYFRNARNLITLDIETNSIPHLDSKLFIEAPNLETIILFNNDIETIHPEAFYGLEKLVSLELFYNKITFLDPHTFSHLQSLSMLRLDENECIDRYFMDINGQFNEIEQIIEEKCQHLYK